MRDVCPPPAHGRNQGYFVAFFEHLGPVGVLLVHGNHRVVDQESDARMGLGQDCQRRANRGRRGHAESQPVTFQTLPVEREEPNIDGYGPSQDGQLYWARASCCKAASLLPSYATGILELL